MRNVLLLFAVLCLPVVAQELNIVQLSDADRSKALVILQKQWELDALKKDFQSQIIHNYLESDSDKSGCVVDRMVVKESWGCAEFTISLDGKFIAPAPFSHYSGLYEMKDGSATQITAQQFETGSYPE